MKIVALGPFYPYKGGIEQFTTLMSRALSKGHEIVNVSYSVQYPKILFPRNEQKDYTDTAFKVDNTVYWLNTINPITYFSSARKIKKLDPDIIIFQWFHPYFAPAYWTLCKLLSKNIKKLFIVHNVLPHEKFPLQRVLAKSVFKNADAFITLSGSEEQNLKSVICDAYIVRAELPPLFSERESITKQAARGMLGISESDFVMLFFGYIREYKGLKVLLEAYPKIITEIPNTVLIIAGEYNKEDKDDYLALISSATIAGGRIINVGDYIPDTEVGKYFTACDVVVAPYLSATQSGVISIAYAYCKPVIATNVGGLPEVVIDGETGFLVPAHESEALSGAVLKFAYEHKKLKFTEHIRNIVNEYSWGHFVETVEEIWRTIQL